MNEEWLRRAKTPETRASIRHWHRWNSLFFWVGLLLVLGGISFIVWSVVTDLDNRPVFWGLIAAIVVLVLICVGFGSHANSRLVEARFADGQESVGRVEKVINHAGTEADDTCDIVVSASVSGSVIHRKLDGLSGHSRVGDTVRFRHNTVDPDDLDDVLFEGWHGRGPHRGGPDWSANQSRDAYARGHVSVGRVEEVVSHPGIPGDHGLTNYWLTVSVELPGPVTLRRQVHVDERQLRSSGRRFGRTIHLRHNTLDQANPFDACFDGWADEVKSE